MSYHGSNFIIGQRAAERLASVLQGVNLRATGADFTPFGVPHLSMFFYNRYMFLPLKYDAIIRNYSFSFKQFDNIEHLNILSIIKRRISLLFLKLHMLFCKVRLSKLINRI